MPIVIYGNRNALGCIKINTIPILKVPHFKNIFTEK